ncbi:MAG: TonB family protein, partial [Deltaproteobacteria bacterium]|nr:TonB family protein [Deltaproteobacteria bacterium]
GRETVAELGTRYGLITPYTSYYVPSERELREMGEQASLLFDRPLLPVGPTEVPPRSAIPHARSGIASLGVWFAYGCSRADRAPAHEERLQESRDDQEGGRGARSRGEEGTMGAASATKSAPTTGGSAAEAEAPPPPDEHQARANAREAAASAGVIGVLRAGSGSWNAPAQDQAAAQAPPASPTPAPAGTEAALGNDPMSALGALMGNQVGDNFGFGGLGLRGTGRGGGGTGEGTIGLGNLGTIGHGAGGGSGSGYGRGAGSLHGREASVPIVRTGNAQVVGSLSSEVIRRVIRRHINEVRFCYERALMQQPELAGRVSVRFVIGSTGAVQSASIATSTLGNANVESCIVSAVRRWTFPAPEGGGIVAVTYPWTLQREGGPVPPEGERRAATTPPEPAVAPAEVAHDVPVPVTAPEPSGDRTIVEVTIETDADRTRRSSCNEASRLPLEERTTLWRERLAQQSGADAYVAQYRRAGRECETPTWRDKRALLALIVDRAGDVSTMVDVYRQLARTSAAAFLRAAILGRIRTPADLRLVRQAFGLTAEPSATLIEQMLARATTPDAKVRVFRSLVAQYPTSVALALRLLGALEDARRLPEARRLADALRADPTSDATVRTAIGEMFLRSGQRDEARRVFSEIVEFAPLDELARRRLGDLYRAHGWSHDAYRQYRTLATIRPDDPTVSLLLAQAAAGAGRIDEALRLEQTLSETSEPGRSGGVARTAMLWSSVRFAKLRAAARSGSSGANDAALRALTARMRRSGVLREATALRAALTWSHPDARLALWASHPSRPLARPADIAPELGIEVFEVVEQESGTYRLEVRRTGDTRTAVSAELVLVWNEGLADEHILLLPLRFDAQRRAFAWTIDGRTL